AGAAAATIRCGCTRAAQANVRPAPSAQPASSPHPGPRWEPHSRAGAGANARKRTRRLFVRRHCGRIATRRGHFDRGANLVLDLLRDLRMLAQEFAGVVLALTDLLAFVRVPRTRLFNDPVI